jgi:hypothetical protein
MSQRIYDNLNALKALEDTDKELAIKAISDPDLDRKELAELIEGSLMGKIVFKKDNTPLKLSNEVVMAGIRNLFFNMVDDQNTDPIM